MSSKAPKNIPKSIFYNPLSKPLNVYTYPHTGELYAQEERRTSEEINNSKTELGKVTTSTGHQPIY